MAQSDGAVLPMANGQNVKVNVAKSGIFLRDRTKGVANPQVVVTDINKGNQQINKVAHQTFTKKKYPNGPPPKSVQTKFVTGTVIPSVQSQIDGIKALGAPTGDEAQVTAIVDSAQSALDKAKADPTTLLQNNPKNDPFAKANQLTKAYGLTACGGGG